MFVETFRQAWFSRVPELHATCQEKFQEKQFFGKIIISETNFGIFGKNFSTGLSKLNSTFPEEHFRKNLILEEIIFSQLFSAFEQKISVSWEKMTGLSKMYSTCQKEHFEAKYFFGEKLNFTITFGL